MDDTLVLVDLFDNEIGKASKIEVHEKGLLHRAFSVFIVNDGRMLIQKRNRNKYHSGGLWTNACCSHPRYGELLDEAVIRRIKEELGITSQFYKAFSFVYRSTFKNGITEYEYDHVFLSDYNGNIAPDEDEIEEYKWIGLEELADDLVSYPDKYTAWFQIAAPKVLELVYESDEEDN